MWRKLNAEDSMHEGKEGQRRCSKSKNPKQNDKINEEQDEETEVDVRCSNSSSRSKRQRSVSRQWSKVKEAMHPNN